MGEVSPLPKYLYLLHLRGKGNMYGHVLLLEFSTSHTW